MIGNVGAKAEPVSMGNEPRNAEAPAEAGDGVASDRPVSTPARVPLALIPDPAFVVDCSGQLVDANAAAEALLGRCRQELIGASVTDIVQPWAPDAGGRWRQAEIRGKDERRVPVHLWTAPVPEGAGAAVFLCRHAAGAGEAASPTEADGDPAAVRVAVIRTAPDGTIIWWDAAAERLYGYRADEVVGRSAQVLTPPEFVGEMDRLWKRVQRGDAVGHHQTQQLTKDGHRLDVTLDVSPVRDERGDVVAALAAARPSAPGSPGAALRASEARFRAAFADAPIGMALTTPDGRFVQVNRALCAIFGYAEGELLATTLPAVTHPDDRAADRVPAARLLAGEVATYQVEKRYVRQDGAVVWGRLSASLVRDEAGRARYFVAQIQDITPYKAVGAALRASEARFRAAFADAPIGMALTTPDGRFVQVNRALCAIFGYAEGELLATTLPAVTHPDDRAADRVPAARLLAGEVATYQVEKRYVRQDGAVVWGELSASLVRDEAGHPLHVVAQIQDISERKRAEAALRAAKEAAEEASRLKSEFLSTMSHELRTPLTAIIGYTHLLLDAGLGPQETADVGQISRSADHLLALIDDLLDLSRIEAGRFDLSQKDVDVTEVLDGVVAEIVPQAVAKGLTVAVDVPAGLPCVRGDPIRLHQLLLNLVGNAVKFTEQGGVTVAARVMGGQITIAVTDTGIGIAPEALPFVFDEFRQADGSTTRRYGGSGLGLAIAARLARMHGGTITVESAPSHGSTFVVALPVPPPASALG